MNDQGYDYDELVHGALVGVVRDLMSDAAEHGLPGGHHFYITFATRVPGVDIPDYLTAQYPDEMPLILQHQYWGLEVENDAFEVTLSFKGKQERLRVPFSAITAFADPSVNFVLRLGVVESEETAAAAEGGGDGAALSDSPSDADQTDGGNVVSIDAFRKN